MNQELPPLTSYSEELRQRAMDKYRVIAPYLNHEESLKNIAEESGAAASGTTNLGALLKAKLEQQ